MAFCQLSQGQSAALMVLWTLQHNDKAPQGLKDAIAQKDWAKIATVLSVMAPKGSTPPTESDLATVGNMPVGLQSAHFFLMMVDLKATDDAKGKMQEALNTHCWDNVTQQVLPSMSQTGIQFTGEDLRQAYAPNDHSPCETPPTSPIVMVLGGLITGGEMVGDFFSKTLPDFFTNDVANFFTSTIPDFFTGPFVSFFEDLGNDIKNGFEEMGDALESAFKKLDPTTW